jgi:hypothetical protein
MDSHRVSRLPSWLSSVVIRRDPVAWATVKASQRRALVGVDPEDLANALDGQNFTVAQDRCGAALA